MQSLTFIANLGPDSNGNTELANHYLRRDARPPSSIGLATQSTNRSSSRIWGTAHNEALDCFIYLSSPSSEPSPSRPSLQPPPSLLLLAAPCRRTVAKHQSMLASPPSWIGRGGSTSSLTSSSFAPFSSFNSAAAAVPPTSSYQLSSSQSAYPQTHFSSGSTAGMNAWNRDYQANTPREVQGSAGAAGTGSSGGAPQLPPTVGSGAPFEGSGSGYWTSDQGHHGMPSWTAASHGSYTGGGISTDAGTGPDYVAPRPQSAGQYGASTAVSASSRHYASQPSSFSGATLPSSLPGNFGATPTHYGPPGSAGGLTSSGGSHYTFGSGMPSSAGSESSFYASLQQSSGGSGSSSNFTALAPPERELHGGSHHHFGPYVGAAGGTVAGIGGGVGSSSGGGLSQHEAAHGHHHAPYAHYGYHDGYEHRPPYFNPFEVKHRRRTTRSQFKVLESTFIETPKPSAATRKALSEQLDMPLRAVQIWFQNRRAKAKAQAKKDASQSGRASSPRNPNSARPSTSGSVGSNFHFQGHTSGGGGSSSSAAADARPPMSSGSTSSTGSLQPNQHLGLSGMPPFDEARRFSTPSASSLLQNSTPKPLQLAPLISPGNASGSESLGLATGSASGGGSSHDSFKVPFGRPSMRSAPATATAFGSQTAYGATGSYGSGGSTSQSGTGTAGLLSQDELYSAPVTGEQMGSGSTSSTLYDDRTYRRPGSSSSSNFVSPGTLSPVQQHGAGTNPQQPYDANEERKSNQSYWRY